MVRKLKSFKPRGAAKTKKKKKRIWARLILQLPHGIDKGY